MLKMLGIFLTSAAFSIASAGVLESWRALDARYTIFSGQGLADSEAPTKTDRKLAIYITGRPARDIFDSIGPDIDSDLELEKGDRQREKKGVQCMHRARNGASGYRCWIGIDLRTGNTVATVGC